MKILQVSHSFYPCLEAGGVVKVCYEISRALVKRGHQVTVVTTDGCSHRLNIKTNCDLNIEGMHVWYFRNISNYLRIKLKFATPYMLPLYLKKNIRDFNVIHIHEHRTVLAVFVSYYAKKYRIPYVIHGHGSISREVSGKSLKKLFDILFGYSMIKGASRLIAVSNEEAHHYLKFTNDPDKIIVMYNGIDIGTFNKLPQPGLFKEKYGIHGKMILFLGRINKTKGLEFAIRAFSELVKIREDVTFIIAGSDDGYTSHLEKLRDELDLRNKVLFIGSVETQDKIAAFRDADLFVHTVLYMGGVGLTPLEAILCNCPIVVTPECGEIIIQSNSGYIVQYGDIKKLTMIMQNVLNNPPDYCMINRGIEYIHNNFTWTKYIDKTETLYRSIAR